MDQSMMVRTDHAKILRTVILHLGDGFDVMNFKYGECCGGIVPFIRSRLYGFTTINLAIWPGKWSIRTIIGHTVACGKSTNIIR